jgi:hypothetical protein
VEPGLLGTLKASKQVPRPGTLEGQARVDRGPLGNPLRPADVKASHLPSKVKARVDMDPLRTLETSQCQGQLHSRVKASWVALRVKTRDPRWQLGSLKGQDQGPSMLGILKGQGHSSLRPAGYPRGSLRPGTTEASRVYSRVLKAEDPSRVH